MIRRRYLAALILLVAFLFVMAPASAAWGARFKSGSAIGFGTVFGIQKAARDGANLNSVVAHPGAQFCTKKSHDDHHGSSGSYGAYGSSHDRDDCNDRDHDRDSSGYAMMSAPPPSSTPGVVFCQNIDYPSMVVVGSLVNLPVNLTGTAFIDPHHIYGGTASFEIHDQIDPATLNHIFVANNVCPTMSSDDSSYKGKSKPSSNKYKPQWESSGTNWTLVDFVPQKFAASLVAADHQGHILTEAILDCTFPTGPYVPPITSLGFHQQVEYNCHTRFNQ